MERRTPFINILTYNVQCTKIWCWFSFYNIVHVIAYYNTFLLTPEIRRDRLLWIVNINTVCYNPKMILKIKKNILTCNMQHWPSLTTLEIHSMNRNSYNHRKSQSIICIYVEKKKKPIEIFSCSISLNRKTEIKYPQVNLYIHNNFVYWMYVNK